ncbi:MAG: hypothetical protein RLZZ373_1027 [Pseudomonadota bacterium]
MARPTKFRPEFADQAKKLCKLGATDAEMASFFGVVLSTFHLWKLQHPEFAKALKDAKAPANERVVRSLYQRAVGYEHDEVDIRVVAGEIVQTTVRKHYPPDTTACIFWLKNRLPGEWRDRTEHELANRDGVPFAMLSAATMSDDQLAAIAARISPPKKAPGGDADQP